MEGTDKRRTMIINSGLAHVKIRPKWEPKQQYMELFTFILHNYNNWVG